MKHKIWSTLMIVVLVGSLVLSACGNPATPVATSAPTAAPTATPEPAEPAAGGDQLVVLAGTIQAQLGCEADWTPDCDKTALEFDADNNVWSATYDLAAGSYELKVTVGGTWDENYGAEGAAGGDNIQFGVSEDAPITFTFDPETHVLELSGDALTEFVAAEPTPMPADIEFEMVVLAGTFQAQLGCAADWTPDCENSALEYDEVNKKWSATFDLKQGSYEFKAAVNGGWDINFGKDGKAGGDNIALTLVKDAPVTFTFHEDTKMIDMESEGIDTTPPAASSEGNLVIWADQTRAPALRELSAAFKDEYGIEITVEELSLGDIRDLFTVAAPAGEGPDIIVGAHDWLGELVSSGLLAPIDLGDKEEDFAPSALQAFSYNNELYGMPNAIENVAFFRNTDLVPDAPQTWDEVVEVSTELAEDNTDDVEKNQYGFVRQEGDPYHFYPIQTAFGGYVFGLTEEGAYNPEDVGIDNEGSLAAAQWYADYLEAGLQPPSVDGETMVSWFEKGKAAMIITGPWFLPRIQESGVNFEISDIPAAEQPGQPFMGAQGFMVNAFSKEPLLAQVFLSEFVANMETMTALYESQPRPPAYLPLLDTLEDPALAAFAKAGANAQPMPAIPAMGSVWEAWTNALMLVAQGGDTPDSAFKNAAEQIRTAIAEGN